MSLKSLGIETLEQTLQKVGKHIEQTLNKLDCENNQ